MKPHHMLEPLPPESCLAGFYARSCPGQPAILTFSLALEWGEMRPRSPLAIVYWSPRTIPSPLLPREAQPTWWK